MFETVFFRIAGPLRVRGRSIRIASESSTMRELHVDHIVDAVARLAVQANCCLPDDLYTAFCARCQSEPSPVGRDMLRQIVHNADIAASEQAPICQDTGFAVVFADMGQDLHIVGGLLSEAVNQGVAKGYREGWLRKSMVAEPLMERVNTGDNTPAMLHVRLVPGDALDLLLAPKGAGSENKSALAMLTPADGIEGVKRMVLHTVDKAGSSPCPPMTIGVGLGGTMEVAALLAKRASARSLDSHNPDPRYAALEDELLELVNGLGIGPQGLGGLTTAMRVHIEWSPTHIACLPVAVNINCHAARHAHVVL